MSELPSPRTSTAIPIALSDFRRGRPRIDGGRGQSASSVQRASALLRDLSHPPARRDEEPAADDDRVAEDDWQRRGVAPDEPAHDRSPENGRILQGRKHRGAGERESPYDEDETGHRDDADHKHKADVEQR